MKKKNIIIIILCVLLLGSIVTCNVMNMEKIWGYKLIKTDKDSALPTLEPLQNGSEMKQDESLEEYISGTESQSEITDGQNDNNESVNGNDGQQNVSSDNTAGIDNNDTQNGEVTGQEGHDDNNTTSSGQNNNNPEGNGNTDIPGGNEQTNPPVVVTPNATDAPAVTQKPQNTPVQTTSAPATNSPTQRPTHTAAATQAPTPRPTATVKPTSTPTVRPTSTPTAKPTSTPTQKPTNTPRPTAQGTPQVIYSPLTLIITKTGGSESGYCKEQLSTKGKYVDIEREVDGNDFKFHFSYKADGKTKVLLLFDDGSFTRPQYFYVYELTANGGKVTGKKVGEYAYSAGKKQYMDMMNGRALVDNTEMKNMLSAYGINYTPATPTPAPTSTPTQTAAPTSGPSNTPKPTATPTASPTPTPFYSGSWKSITLSTSAQGDKWILSSKYNQNLVSTKSETSSHQDGGTTFYDYKFTFTSKDVPGSTNVCFAYYDNHELDALEIYRIVIADNGKMSFDRTRSLARGSDGTFGNNQAEVETLVTQFALQWTL